MNKSYSKKVLKHFRNPHNYGKMKDPDGIGKVGNIVCGDVMWIYIKVAKNKKGKEVIKDIKFETFGCVAALATSSVITDLAKGKTLNQALKIDNKKVIKALEGLPPIKIHCSVLASHALAEAIYNYFVKNKRKISQSLEKKHQRRKQERKLIEEKYKEWIKIEEEMHKKQE